MRTHVSQWTAYRPIPEAVIQRRVAPAASRPSSSFAMIDAALQIGRSLDLSSRASG
jgi:hypothetical protein